MAQVVAQIFQAMRPGGWLLTATVPPPVDDLDAAIVRWRVTEQGGTVATPEQITQRLRGVGFDPVRTLRSTPVVLLAAQRPMS